MQAPINGGRLENVLMPVMDGDPATFTRVNVSDDGCWEYFWMTDERLVLGHLSANQAYRVPC